MAKTSFKLSLLRDNKGASLTGYALLVGLISVIGILAIQNIGGGVTGLFDLVGNRLTAAGDGSGGGGGSSPAPNAQPSFVPSADPQFITLAAGTQSVSNFALFNMGGGDVGQSVLDYIIVELGDIDNAVSSVDIDNNGNLSLVSDSLGSETIRVQVQDDGGTVNGGIDTSVAVDFVITVLPVPNVKPSVSFAINPVETLYSASSQNVSSFALFDQGAGDVGQSVLDYSVTALNDMDNAIAVVDIDNSGNLSFTTSAVGSETIRVQVQDDGGTVNGGVDLSDTVDFIITVSAGDCTAFAGAGVFTIDPDGAGSGVAPFDVECDASGYIMLTVDSGGNAFFYNKNSFGFDGTTRCLNADSTSIPSYYAQISSLPAPDFDHSNIGSGTDSNHTHNITYRRPGTGSNYSNAQIAALNLQISEYGSGIKQIAHTCDDDGFNPNHEVTIISATGSTYLMTNGYGDPAGTNAYITDWIYTHNTATVADELSPAPAISPLASAFLLPVQVRFTQRGSGLPNADYYYGGMAWGFNQLTLRVR